MLNVDIRLYNCQSISKANFTLKARFCKALIIIMSKDLVKHSKSQGLIISLAFLHANKITNKISSSNITLISFEFLALGLTTPNLH